MTRTVDGYPIVKRECDAYAVYDADAHEVIAYAPGNFWNADAHGVIAYAPGNFWSLAKSKALREKGTGHRVYFVGFPA